MISLTLTKYDWKFYNNHFLVKITRMASKITAIPEFLKKIFTLTHGVVSTSSCIDLTTEPLLYWWTGNHYRRTQSRSASNLQWYAPHAQSISNWMHCYQQGLVSGQIQPAIHPKHWCHSQHSKWTNTFNKRTGSNQQTESSFYASPPIPGPIKPILQPCTQLEVEIELMNLMIWHKMCPYLHSKPSSIGQSATNTNPVSIFQQSMHPGVDLLFQKNSVMGYPSTWTN